MANEKILVTQSSMPPYEEYIEAIKPLWESHWLTNMGTYHKELEEELKQYLGVPELSLMVNGHMALEMAIQAFDFPEDSEVITTPFTFVSTTHAIVRNRLKPVFCDVKMSDGTIDETKIEDLITEKTVAIVPVHVYGNVCNVEAIQEIADKYNLDSVVGSDAHTVWEIGRSYMMVNCIPDSPETFKQAIKCATFHKKKCLKFSHKITKLVKLLRMLKKGNFNEIYRVIKKRFGRTV